jgi:hypothetical protein
MVGRRAPKRLESREMIKQTAAALFIFTMLLVSGNAAAAERVQAGEWETTMTIGSGKPMVTKYCITPAEARSMNGDEAGLRKYLEASTAENTGGRCLVRSVTLKGDVTTVAIVCGKTELVTSTRYLGDKYESSSSNGAKVAGKRLGTCKSVR